MRLSALAGRWWTALDYGYVLPLLARLPRAWGRWLAGWRGRCYGRWRRDWRSFSFDDTALYERTRQTMTHLKAQAMVTPARIEEAVARRYEMQSLEEYEAACLVHCNIDAWPVRFEGLAGLEKALRDNPSLVLVTAHFGSSILGTALLGRLGLRVLGMSSNVVDDPRVHPHIGRFYRRKYAAMGRYLPHGGIMDRQGNANRFARHLKRGGVVVIVSDLPPDPHEKPLWRPFLGCTRGFAPGPMKLAEIAGADVMAFVCVHKNGEHVLTFSAPGQEPYAFLAQQIAAAPPLWWAADLLPLLPLSPQEMAHA